MIRIATRSIVDDVQDCKHALLALIGRFQNQYRGNNLTLIARDLCMRSIPQISRPANDRENA